MLGFLAYIYARFSILRMSGIELWAGGHLALAICFFCILVNIDSPQQPLLLIIIISIMATHAMWWGASRSFFKKERLHPLLIMLPALIVIVFSICARASVALKLIEDGAIFRTGYIMLFLSCAFYQLAIAKEFISYRSPRLITSVSVGCAFALVAVLSLFKVITVPESLPPLIISPTTDSMATFVMVAFIQVVSMFGLMLISAERLQFRLHELAQSDPLTGLLNRRGFKLQSDVAIKRRRQGDNICAIMAFDLDHFKLVNDTYGHATGDDVLIAFANCLTENTRTTDIVARFGGEEFIVLCIDVDQADAKKTAKRISEFMAALTIQSKSEEDVSITVSIGIAMIEEDSPDLNLYLDTADTALYNAKARGRNKVVVAEPSAQFSVVI
jgi:diguanylate cyclase (GGDEF)-like protein